MMVVLFVCIGNCALVPLNSPDIYVSHLDLLSFPPLKRGKWGKTIYHEIDTKGGRAAVPLLSFFSLSYASNQADGVSKCINAGLQLSYTDVSINIDY